MYLLMCICFVLISLTAKQQLKVVNWTKDINYETCLRIVVDKKYYLAEMEILK